MKVRPCSLPALLILYSLAVLFAAGAESGGSSISGRVQNAGTGAYLEGAMVTLEPAHRSTLTERDGSFTFSALAGGEYRLVVSYTGLDTQTVAVALAAGFSAAREIALTSQVYAMEKFTVAGEREGNAL